MNRFLELLLGGEERDINNLLEESARLLAKHKELELELVEVGHFIFSYEFTKNTITFSAYSPQTYCELEFHLNLERKAQIEKAKKMITERLDNIQKEIATIQAAMRAPRTSLAEAN